LRKETDRDLLRARASQEIFPGGWPGTIDQQGAVSRVLLTTFGYFAMVFAM